MKQTIHISIWEEDGDLTLNNSYFAKNFDDAIGFLQKYGNDKAKEALREELEPDRGPDDNEVVKGDGIK